MSGYRLEKHLLRGGDRYSSSFWGDGTPVECSTDHDHGPVEVSNEIMGSRRSLNRIALLWNTTKKVPFYCGRFRAGALGRENCSLSSLTDSCVSALTPLPLSVPLGPARVGIDDEDEDVEEEASSFVRKVLFISFGSDVSTLRVAKGLAPSTERVHWPLARSRHLIRKK